MPFPYGQDFKEARLFGTYVTRKRVTFDGTAGGGEAGTPVPVFTVVDGVHITVVGVCEQDLTVSDGATIELGTASGTAALIALTTAANLDVDEIWFDATPSAIKAQSSIGGAWLVEEEIVITVGTANVTGGVILFVCFWTPLSETGTVVAS